jgi:phosphatidylinositol glycan class V
VIANQLIDDHKADAFNPPRVASSQSNSIESTIHYLLNGFRRWDGVHFTHIAQYGYIYENNIAFFPLYPLTTNLLSKYIIKNVVSINDYESILLSSIFTNIFISLITTIYLYKLTKLLFNNEQMAFTSSMIFIFNPATIFFIAPYSESLFLMLTIISFYFLYENKYFISLSLFSLSCLTRSNGLVNFLFIAFYLIKSAIPNLLDGLKQTNFFGVLKYILRKKNVFVGLWLVLKVFFALGCFLSSFSLYQYYIYYKFCVRFANETSIPDELIEYGNENLYSLGGFEWCDKFIPFSYTNVQSKYWNVGFMKYWQFKQIPNFILAMPILLISIFSIRNFLFSLNKNNFLFNIFGFKIKKDEMFIDGQLFGKYQHHVFVFIAHLIVLTVSSLFFMHVQVIFYANPFC